MKNYLAVLDFNHLENPIFLKSFAQSLSNHGIRKGIIIHGDSEYTDRLMQTGMMREDARKRAVMDLNRRLITLFADHGVSAIGMNGFQKELISKNNDDLIINRASLEKLPQSPVLLISSLVSGSDSKEPVYVPPFELAKQLIHQLDNHILTMFSQSEYAEVFTQRVDKSRYQWETLDPEFLDKHLSDEQRSLGVETILTTSLGFAEWPEPKNSTVIR